MSNWFNQVKDDLTKVIDAIEHFEAEFDAARLDTSIKGHLEKLSRDMPGIIAYRFAQLQEIEAILEFLNIEARKKQRMHYRKYLEGYNRALSSRDAEKYAEGEQDVIDMDHLVNEFALVRNKFIGITKALEAKGFQINNIVRLRAAGMDDIILG
jgi:uncharacterized protein YfdQ (DUF2303 family)